MHKTNNDPQLSLPTWSWVALLISSVGTAALITALTVIMLNERGVSDTKTPTQSVDSLSFVHTTIESLPSLTPVPPTATYIATNEALPTNTSQPTATLSGATLTASFTPSSSVTQIAQSAATEVVNESCPLPDGWERYTVQQGDTLFAFQLGAGQAGTPTTVDQILAANCIDNRFLSIGQILYLPEGAADNAPSSEPAAPALPAGVARTANCPCQLTIQPGWRIEQIADAINRTPVAFSGADFLAIAGRGSALPTRSFLAGVPAGSGLEGFMLPGTYTLQNATTAIEFRDLVLDAFGANAAAVMNSATAQGITPYEALIMASIIVRESGNPAEQPIVASVFYNRLATGRAFSATVTIQYALGSSGNWWPRLQSGQTSINSPYNTYRFQGFPPTPISNPSLSAIQAAAAPAQTNYLYFTGDCRGPGNAYAATYEEHLANVNCE